MMKFPNLIPPKIPLILILSLSSWFCFYKSRNTLGFSWSVALFYISCFDSSKCYLKYSKQNGLLRLIKSLIETRVYITKLILISHKKWKWKFEFVKKSCIICWAFSISMSTFFLILKINDLLHFFFSKLTLKCTWIYPSIMRIFTDAHKFFIRI